MNLLYGFLLDTVNFHYLISKIISAGFVLLWNFFARKFILFYQKAIMSLKKAIIRGHFKGNLNNNSEYDPNIHWEKVQKTYSYYPTVRHRKRFIINALKKYSSNKRVFVFDYGCGEGSILNEIKKMFKFNDNQLGGCDISKKALHIAKQKVKTAYLYNELCPKLDKKYDVIICSEVIEHTRDYLDILYWINNNLTSEGLLILTTQSGKIHKSDRYTGHEQHFDMTELISILQQLGFTIKYSSLWGFPFFTLQKYLTDINFENIKKNYLEGELSLRKKIIFKIAYLIYFLHDLIRLGPQIYIIALKNNKPGNME
jgi:ubiquinone/menaquinone biosynthesis C-methylase UbiE